VLFKTQKRITMNTTSEVKISNTSIVGNTINFLFGIVVLAIGVVNMFWGNDLYFGIFLALLSFVYFLPVNTILRKIAGFSIPRIGLLKIALGIFIIWAALGVGELFNKIELMVMGL